MNAIVRSFSRGGAALYTLILIALIAVGFSYVNGLDAEAQEELLYLVQDFLPIIMFLSLAFLLFSGFPVAFILGGLAMLFGLLGYFLDSFSLIEYFNFIPRIWGQACENLVLS